MCLAICIQHRFFQPTTNYVQKICLKEFHTFFSKLLLNFLYIKLSWQRLRLRFPFQNRISTTACQYSNCCELYPQIHHLSALVISHFSLKQNGRIMTAIWDPQLRREMFPVKTKTGGVHHHKLRSIFPLFTFNLGFIESSWVGQPRGSQRMSYTRQPGISLSTWITQINWVTVSTIENNIIIILAIHHSTFPFILLTDFIDSHILVLSSYV